MMTRLRRFFLSATALGINGSLTDRIQQSLMFFEKHAGSVGAGLAVAEKPCANLYQRRQAPSGADRQDELRDRIAGDLMFLDDVFDPLHFGPFPQLDAEVDLGLAASGELAKEFADVNNSQSTNLKKFERQGRSSAQ